MVVSGPGVVYGRLIAKFDCHTCLMKDGVMLWCWWMRVGVRDIWTVVVMYFIEFGYLVIRCC